MKSVSNIFSVVVESLQQIATGDDPKSTAGRQSQLEEVELATIALAASVIQLKATHTVELENLLLDFLGHHFGNKQLAKRKKQIKDHLAIGSQPYLKMACEQLKATLLPASKLEVLELLFRLASHHTFISTRELKLLVKIASYLDINDENIESLKSTYMPLHSPYMLLGIEDGCSKAAIKAAYRKMALKFHPDKNQENTSLEFRAIRDAYELLMRD